MEFMARGFIVMLMISMPCVLVAAGIGLVVGILQAVTQVQEQTIAAAPKILAVFLVLIIGGYGYVRLLTNLVSDGFSIAFNVIPKNDSYVLPFDYYKYTRPFAGEMNDKMDGKTNLKNSMDNTGRTQFNESKQGIKYFPSQKTQGPRPTIVETRKILNP